VPNKCSTNKSPKYAIGPPTSSASLLAFAPPVNNYLKPEPTSEKNSNDFSNSRSSASDPLIPVNSASVSPYATTDIVSVIMAGMGTSRPSVTSTTTNTGTWLTADLPDVEFPRKNLKFVEMLGEGQFGEVKYLECVFTEIVTVMSNRCIVRKRAVLLARVTRSDADDSCYVCLQLTSPYHRECR